MAALTIDLYVRTKAYARTVNAPSRTVLSEVRLQMHPGEFVALLGPSGCGKTTLLNIVAGLDRDYQGHIRFPGLNGRTSPTIGYVFQNPRLLPWLTVRENIELVLPHPDRQRVDDLIAAVGLNEATHLHPTRLSLGMSRRAALARAFVIEPDLLLMDEPFTSLDEPTARRLRLLLIEVWRRHRTTVLFVTHDLREAITLADRIVFLASAPTTIAREVTVPIARARRHDDALIERYRTELLG